MGLWLQQEADTRDRDTGLWRPLPHPVMPLAIHVIESPNLFSLLLSQELLLMLRDEGLEHCHPGHRVKIFYWSMLWGTLARCKY